MSKKVDIDLIVAFIEGSLSNEKRKYIRERIDNDNDWFLEYMNLKEGEYQYKSYLGENTDVEEFSSNLLPNKNETVFASIAAGTPFFNAVIVGIVAVGGLSLIYFETIIKGINSFKKAVEGQPSVERQVESGELTRINFSRPYIIITNNSLEELNISILIKKDTNNQTIPNDAYYSVVPAGEEITINYEKVYEFFNIDYIENFPLEIIIYDNKESIKQKMIIE
tara:strand:- start:5104 stop:5772 length:669 start_codon:yes stop_codon:yes gene_type:complete